MIEIADLIEKRSQTDLEARVALFGPETHIDGEVRRLMYRYRLRIVWDNSLPDCQFIGLNPSKATHEEDDPTVTRCIRFAKTWGCGALNMTNLFAFRSTKPEDMKRAASPIGAVNDDIIEETARSSEIVIAAWGRHGAFLERSARVIKNLAGIVDLKCLAANDDGSPVHPLYQPKNRVPIRYPVGE